MAGREWSRCFSRVVFYLLRKPDQPLQRSAESSSMEALATDEHTKINSEIVDNNKMNSRCEMTPNMIVNHDFSEGLTSWHPNCCQGIVASTEAYGKLEERLTRSSGSNYAVVTNRTECWQGLEQDITSRISADLTYTVSACVRVVDTFDRQSDVQATLKLEDHDSATEYLSIARIPVSGDKWEKLKGTFTLSTIPKRVVFYLEGPSPGVDLLIKSVLIYSSSPSSSQDSRRTCDRNNPDDNDEGNADGNDDGNDDGDDEDGHDDDDDDDDENVIINPQFQDALINWSGRGCKITLQESMNGGKILPKSGKVFAVATGRTQTWNGIQQEITGRAKRKLAYEVNAVVRIYGNNVSSSDVRATLWVQMPDYREQYIGISSVQATDNDWAELQGKFLLNGSPSHVVIYLEGPPSGVDILVNSFVVKHAKKTPPSPPPNFEDAAYGVNVVQNSELNSGTTDGWFPLGNCTLNVRSGSPRILPPMAKGSLGAHEQLSGQYILIANRSQTWMGPAQMITDQLKLFLTYQVSTWVKIGSAVSGPQSINVSLSVDDQWVNGGQVEITDDRWHEVGGSFRLEKQPSKVMVYLQGPSPGIDFMVAGLMIFAVDRRERFRQLKMQTDKIRKRDVVLKLSGIPCPAGLFGSFVRIRQIENSFPLGTCINRTNIDNEDFVAFFLEHFNWSVFGNELKWYWTESQQGNLNYKDADEMLDLCVKNNIQVRGHCIFWEVEGTVQSWVRSLPNKDLLSAVQNRLNSLLTRYKGKFKHYDVNNEMLHGSFYQDRLGKDIRANMFKRAHQLEPDALLFVNDYHIEDGDDTRSTPEKYVQQILKLQGQGAQVGGIGIQGHIDSPVGSVVCSALDQLGTVGLPIWFTELDVSSTNEHVRADDLEVMLREAFAHPAVEGIMLWGFWELFMSRDNSHLVNAEGDLNAAGCRLIELKREWMSHDHGFVDENGEFCFRGFHGTYEVEVYTFSKNVKKTIVVDKGESPLVLSIDL